jgi:hypothetical protein
MKINFSDNRRSFIKNAAIFSGFAALLGMIRPAPAQPKEPLPQHEPPSQGYRLTEHIRKYYETARP